MSVPIVAIKGALELALFNLDVTPFPTAWENRDFTPAVGTPYQRVFFMPTRPENPTMGSTHYRTRGILRIALCYPSNNAGSAPAAKRADQICTLFKRGSAFTDSGLVINIDRTPYAKQGVPVDGWFIQTIDVYWWVDIFA